MMRSAYVVLVDPIVTGAPFKETARELGLGVVAVYTMPASSLLAATGAADLDEVTPGDDISIFASSPIAALRAIRDRLAAPIAAVVAGTEPGVACADYLARALELPGNDPAHSLARRDKAEMKRAAAAAGIAVPAYTTCKTAAECDAFIERVGLPIVVKTPRGAGTDHVYVARSVDHAHRCVARVSSALDLFGAVPPYVVLEQWIGGTEYAVNTFSDGARVHVVDVWEYDKVRTAHADCVYRSMIQLSRDTPAAIAASSCAVKVARAVGVSLGPAHVEIKIDGGIPYLIEIGARLAGVKIPSLWARWSNHHPYRDTLRTFIDGTIELPRPVEFDRHLGLAFVPNESATGRISAIDGLDAIRALPSFVDLDCKLRPGQLVQPTHDLATIPLITRLANPDANALRTDVERVHELFSIHTQPELQTCLSR